MSFATRKRQGSNVYGRPNKELRGLYDREIHAVLDELCADDVFLAGPPLGCGSTLASNTRTPQRYWPT